MLDFSAMVRSRRAILRQTMAEAAEAIGVSETTVHRWENGRVPVRAVDVLLVARWLDEPPPLVFERLIPELETQINAAA